MSLTSTFQTSTSTAAGTSTPAITASPTNPAFFGWQSLINTDYSGTPIYESGTCTLGSTFSASSTLAACCGPSCTLFSTCIGGTALIGAGGTSTCGALSTCKTDYIYQTAVDAVPTQALYCETGADTTWFRTMPTPGVDSSEVPTSNDQGSGVPWGGIGGGGGGGLIVLAIIIWCCCASRRRTERVYVVERDNSCSIM